MISSEWAVSRAVSHLALVSEANFVAVQGLRATRARKDGATDEPKVIICGMSDWTIAAPM